MPLPRALAATVLLWSCVTLASPKVRILGSIEGGKPQPAWVYARSGQRVLLHADAPANVKSLRWYRIEPTTRSADNTQPSFHWAPISYRTDELTACRDKRTCTPDVTPVHMPRNAHLEGLGTMAFQLEAVLPDGTTLKTPGADSLDRGGLSRHVFRVAIRKSDSYLGYLSELANTPYIFGSAGAEGSHQADLLVGSDCADLAVYGIRRAGRTDVPYVSTWTIEKHAPLLAVAEQQTRDGTYATATQKPITHAREGDLILFPSTRHVGVLWEDRDPVRVLDENDLLLHTCWAPPTVEPLGTAACSALPMRVLRFR